MKYGQNFEHESVPEWSLHNIDYNSLKHHIKAHTTKGQGTRAIAIPGQQDVALKKFEDDLYAELCRQHDRVGLFVASKADELSRRLQHLSDCIHNTLRRCVRRRMSAKWLRRLARYGQAVVQCGDEIQDLARFVNAQVTAFSKILKKYKKWTGSHTLGARFKEYVLSDPKSFTNRDFHQLETQYEDLISELRAVTPTDDSGTVTPSEQPATPARRRSVQHQAEPLQLPADVSQQQPSGGYWNEYDNGSEAGDGDGGYVIYVNPGEDDLRIPGLSALSNLLSTPVNKAKIWLAGSGNAERQPLLPTNNSSSTFDDSVPGMARSYGGVSRSGADGTQAAGLSGDEEELDLASDGYVDFPQGYDARFAALPSINEQRVARYRDRMLFWGTIGANAASVVLLVVAGVLIWTGRHRLRAEVDAGVIVGVMASLGCACTALGMTLGRDGPGGHGVGLVNSLAVYTVFTVICVLNGALLVLVVGNTAL